MDTQGNRKTLTGKVVRRSGDKSIIVLVERMVMHPRVHKYVRRHKKFHVHDPQNSSLPGDQVAIQEGRPFSRTKRWVLQNLISRPVDASVGVAV